MSCHVILVFQIFCLSEQHLTASYRNKYSYCTFLHTIVVVLGLRVRIQFWKKNSIREMRKEYFRHSFVALILVLFKLVGWWERKLFQLYCSQEKINLNRLLPLFLTFSERRKPCFIPRTTVLELRNKIGGSTIHKYIFRC